MADVIIPNIFVRIGLIVMIAACIAALVMGVMIIIDITTDKNKSSLIFALSFASLGLCLLEIVVFVIGIIAGLV